MLVGSHVMNSDMPLALRGMGQCDDTSGDCTGAGTSQDPNIYTIYPYPVTPDGTGNSGSPATTTPSGSNSNPFASIASAIASLGQSAANAFRATQTQCSIGTTNLNGQCLPTSAVNYAALTNQPLTSYGANPLSSLSMGSLGGMLPILAIGAVVILMAAKK